MLSNNFVQMSMSEPYRYAQIRGVTTNFSSVTVAGATTFLPPHKGFCITTGPTFLITMLNTVMLTRRDIL